MLQFARVCSFSFSSNFPKKGEALLVRRNAYLMMSPLLDIVNGII
jgi:hypothetical protein